MASSGQRLAPLQGTQIIVEDKELLINTAICLSPAIWILFAFWTKSIFVTKGYQRTESLLIGLFFGPIGVIIAYLIPGNSIKIIKILRITGLTFAYYVFLGLPVCGIIDVYNPLSIFLAIGLQSILIIIIIVLIKKE